jgi:hypothetical protein
MKVLPLIVSETEPQILQEDKNTLPIKCISWLPRTQNNYTSSFQIGDPCTNFRPVIIQMKKAYYTLLNISSLSPHLTH